MKLEDIPKNLKFYVFHGKCHLFMWILMIYKPHKNHILRNGISENHAKIPSSPGHPQTENFEKNVKLPKNGIEIWF